MTTIRVAEESDAEAITAIYAPIVANTAISFEVEPPTADEMRRRIAETLARYPWLVATDGEVLGYAYATQHRARAAYRFAVDVSVYIHERARGRGVGRALYTSLFRVLAAQGYVAAHAGIALPNEASVALHEAVGFVPIGIYRGVGFKFGVWRDAGWWQRALREREPEPREPIPFASLANRESLL